jgi:DDE family transposase
MILLSRLDDHGWKDTYRVGSVREIRRLRRRVRVGAPDPSLTRFAGMAAVTELVDRLNMITLLDAVIGQIKTRDRGFTGGQLLVGMACAQLAGEEFLVGLDRYRADVAGQVLAAVPGLSSTTAAGLARRLSEGQWRAVETGIGDVHAAVLALLPEQQAARLCATVTIDLDTTDVEVYGRHKRGVAFNHQGQRVGRPHVASWAEAATVLAADLMAGTDDPRPHAAELLRRALAALPAPARAGRIRLRADAGYFAGELARAALFADVEFAIGARRIAPLWRILDGVAETAWTDAIDMTNAQVAVAAYCPDWWPAATRLLIRRVRLDVSTEPGGGQVSADPRARRRRTLHPDQRVLPLDELADADTVYGYSFVVTNLDVSTGARAAAVEHWYRHRTSIENIFKDAKLGGALRHLPSGYPEVNTAWMWGALLAASIAGWLHQLTAARGPGEELFGHGVRGGQAMIATLRHRLLRVPARLVRHAGALTLRLPPGHDLLNEVLARIRALPATP